MRRKRYAFQPGDMILHDHERFSVVGVHNYGKSIVNIPQKVVLGFTQGKFKNGFSLYTRILNNTEENMGPTGFEPVTTAL